MIKTCKICKCKFEPKRSTLEPTCDNYDCKVAYALSQVKKQRDKQAKEQKKVSASNKKAAKEKLKTLSDWKNELQKEINTLVRLIDKGHVCISSRVPLQSKYDAGHLFSVGSNPSLRFNLFNIYAQSVHSNQWKSGDQINFLEGLETDFGKEHKEYVLSLKIIYPILKINIDEIKESILIAKYCIKVIKEEDRIFTNEERISLRKSYNKRIGIYM